jgi:glycosyltransferase involved in cell wall biosynthesis
MSKKIKIAFLEYSDIFSGAEMSLHSLIKYLDPSKFESVIYFRYPLEHQERYNDLSCKKQYLSNEKKWWMGSDRWKKPIRGTDFIKRFIFGFKLALIAKKEKVDIIHINLIRPDSFWWFWWPQFLGIKVIGHSRSDPMDWIPSATLQKQSDAIICVSDFIKEKVLIKYNSSSVYTVYDPVDYKQYESNTSKEQALISLEIDPKHKLLASVGLLSSHKGHDMTIRVFARISKQFTDHILMIAGGGNSSKLKKLKALTIEKGIENRTIFTEKQIANVDVVYRASDLVFSLTTRGEAFGRVPFEGNACDTAVLAPDKGASVELIKDNETGFLVDPLDEDAIVLKTIDILSNPNKTKSIVTQGKTHFSQKLSPLNSAQEVGKIYHTVLRKEI